MKTQAPLEYILHNTIGGNRRGLTKPRTNVAATILVATSVLLAGCGTSESESADPTQDRPGNTSILLEYDTKLTVKNTTDSRVLKLSSQISTPATASLFATWPSESAICRAHIRGHYATTVPSSVESAEVCTLELGRFVLDERIPAGASQEFAPEKRASFSASGLKSPGVRSVPEDSVEQILADLNNPGNISLEYYQYGKSPLFAKELMCVDKNAGMSPVYYTVWVSYPTKACQPLRRLRVEQPAPQ